MLASSTKSEERTMAGWPDRIDYRLPEGAAKELEFLAERAADLARVVECSKQQPPGFSLEKTLEPISQKVGIGMQDIRRIFNSLENIKDLREDLGTVESVLGRLISAVAPEIAKKLQEVSLMIIAASKAYGQDNPVTITIKAQRLTYSRERLLHDAEIITDARPIFDSAGTKILEFVITHSLKVDAMVNGEIQQKYVSLDNADIYTLRQACDRAIIKAQTLKNALGTTWSAVIVRDDTDADV